MRFYRVLFLACLLISWSALLGQRTFAAEDTEFQQVLELSGVGSDDLAPFSESRIFGAPEWEVLAQVWYRLGQYSSDELERWSTKPEEDVNQLGVGKLYQVAGEATLLETMRMSADIEPDPTKQIVYVCRFVSDSTSWQGKLLTREIPRRWSIADVQDEPVAFRGVMLGVAEGEVLMLSDRLAWYPRKGVPSGQLLLARHGMDVSLLDEVVHRRPFMRPGQTRESEAFYQCLVALGKTSSEELVRQSRQAVTQKAREWNDSQPRLVEKYQSLKEELAAEVDGADKQKIQKEVKKLRQERTVADAVVKQSAKGLSSLGPLFMQPEKEVGQLYRFEGIARRAVRIHVTDRPDIDHYYELELFTPEAKYLEQRPIVCCVNRLPPGFPEGDMIREPVRIHGIFFKSWLYRSRDIDSVGGETKRPERLYTPVLMSNTPGWLKQEVNRESRWGLWGGIAFLVLLLAGWINWLSVERKDREAKAAMRRSNLEDL